MKFKLILAFAVATFVGSVLSSDSATGTVNHRFKTMYGKTIEIPISENLNLDQIKERVANEFLGEDADKYMPLRLFVQGDGSPEEIFIAGDLLNIDPEIQPIFISTYLKPGFRQ